MQQQSRWPPPCWFWSESALAHLCLLIQPLRPQEPDLASFYLSVHEETAMAHLNHWSYVDQILHGDQCRQPPPRHWPATGSAALLIRPWWCWMCELKGKRSRRMKRVGRKSLPRKAKGSSHGEVWEAEQGALRKAKRILQRVLDTGRHLLSEIVYH